MLLNFLSSVVLAAETPSSRILVDPMIAAGVCHHDFGLNDFEHQLGQPSVCAGLVLDFRQSSQLNQPVLVQLGVEYDHHLGWGFRLAPGLTLRKLAFSAGLMVYPLSLSREEDTTSVYLGIWLRSRVWVADKLPLAVHYELGAMAGATCWPGLPCDAANGLTLRLVARLDR
jgi:hypothetical protein